MAPSNTYNRCDTMEVFDAADLDLLLKGHHLTFWYSHSLSRAVKVSAGMPNGVRSLARRQYCAASYVAQNHRTASQLPTWINKD